MIVLPKCIPLKETSGLLKQFEYHGQVNLGVRQVGMPQVNGEVIHQSLHVGPLTIPLDQSMDCKGMPHIMKSGLVATAVGALDAHPFPQPLECTLQIPSVNRRPAPTGEEVALCLGKGMRCDPPAGVIAQHFAQIRADGNQPRFEKLGIANSEQGVRQVYVCDH